MSPDVLLAVFQVAAGGTLVQLIVYLLRRRSEIKALDAAAKKDDATGGAATIEAQTAYVAQLLADVSGRRTVEDKLNTRIDDLEERLKDEQERALRRETTSSREIDRLTSEVAQLRTDLSIANGQVERLRIELEAAKGRHQL